MLVYRIENENRHGPFGAVVSPIRDSRSYSPPAPWDDGVPIKGWRRVRCGTISILQLFAVWFADPDLDDRFEARNFRITTYDVIGPYVAVGGHQCCFNPDMGLQLNREKVRDVRERLRLFPHFVLTPPGFEPDHRIRWHLESEDFLQLEKMYV